MQRNLEREYSELKAFLAFYADRFLSVEGLPPEKQAMANVARLEQKGASTALKGVRLAVNDCIEMSSRFDQGLVERLDAEMRAKGLVSLSEMRRRYSKDFASIRKRGRIRSETEYYLVRNVLDDTSPKSVEEQRQLQELIDAFEKTLAVRQS